MEDRERAVELIGEAVAGGARRARACELLGIALRTLQRWESNEGGGDQRCGPLKGPENATEDCSWLR